MARTEQTGRRHFVAHIDRAGAAAGAEVRWHCDRWVAELVAGDRRALVIGHVFPLDNAASAQVATDKVATCALLDAGGVPTVPHRLLDFGTRADPLAAVHELAGLPAVLKPHRESGGVDVQQVTDEPGARAALAHLRARYRAIAVSPLLPVQDEYRVVVLDGEVLLVYRKEVAPGEWRHNLRFGARPVLDVDPAAQAATTAQALRAMSALGLRFASVDVVVVDGGPRVLEVNSGVALEHFSRASERHRALAADVYGAAVRACLA
ncbi:ATP-grasp domain-containing protein [Actinosynnema sp. NPDC050436]|uniref:ATP-grasp domain-containing protein n=1 Tax=Actinosynnema sp. NPDC050436 TaxID=3155659 RepID=UPI0033EBEB11